MPDSQEKSPLEITNLFQLFNLFPRPLSRYKKQKCHLGSYLTITKKPEKSISLCQQSQNFILSTAQMPWDFPFFWFIIIRTYTHSLVSLLLTFKELILKHAWKFRSCWLKGMSPGTRVRRLAWCTLAVYSWETYQNCIFLKYRNNCTHPAYRMSVKLKWENACD